MPTADPRSAPDNAGVWPLERADEALEALARRSGLERSPKPAGDDASGRGADFGERRTGSRIADAADRLGLEVEETEVPHSDVEDLVRGCGPALLRVPMAGGDGLLAVLGCRGGRVRVLGSDLGVRRLPLRRVVQWLCLEVEGPALPRVQDLLERLRVSRRRAGRARAALLAERLRHARLKGFWLLRLPPSAGFWRQMRHARLARQLATFLVMYALSYGLLLLSWWLLGRGALAGHLSRDWLLAWALILMTLIAPRQLSTWAQAKLAVGAGTLLKRRLLLGALKLEPDEIRHQGAGQLLGRVIESEAMQTHALAGGFLATIGGIELLMAAWVLSQGAAGWVHVLLLGLWLTAVLLVGWRYLVQRRRWTDDRLTMTHDLVESLIGHRTRLAQERLERWHEAEDQRLEAYLVSSRRMDDQRAYLIVSSYAWVLPGIAGLMPAFVSGTASAAALALAVGGVLLAFRAFNKISRGFTYLTGAWISWRQAAPIYRAAERDGGRPAGRPIEPRIRPGAARPDPALIEARPGAARPDPALIEAQDLAYRYPVRARPVLDGCSLQIHPGDRILLEGPSGGGKSTLAAILSRLRQPTTGLLLLAGLDRHTVTPAAWRRHVVSAPQFHENHVFTETFAFNLLMGRRWPPRPEDMTEAEEICRALGLGELLERMPAGLLQLVGETGWQLSHGERSRLFMARALLQGTEMVILDESFAALDPENLHRALHCALERAPTLLLIAHP